MTKNESIEKTFKLGNRVRVTLHILNPIRFQYRGCVVFVKLIHYSIKKICLIDRLLRCFLNTHIVFFCCKYIRLSLVEGLFALYEKVVDKCYRTRNEHYWGLSWRRNKSRRQWNASSEMDCIDGFHIYDTAMGRVCHNGYDLLQFPEEKFYLHFRSGSIQNLNFCTLS